jgi:DNA-binding transcriptional ArsR family regulator
MLKVDDWSLLGIFENEVRVKIVKLLLELELRSLSEIAERLEKEGWKMTLSGVLKHMVELEKAGVVRHQPGIFAEKPDARKTIYFLEGRERVEKVLLHLENDIINPLRAGVVFGETAEIFRQIQGIGRGSIDKDKKHLESLLAKCESERVYKYLTEDEKKRLKVWRTIISIV